MNWLRRLFNRTAGRADQPDLPAQLSQIQERCRDLEERLQCSDQKLKERSAMLYELQKHYATEHFGFQESARNLKVERLRNAGMFADRDIIVARAKHLQQRIGELKERLARYEPVEDRPFDSNPIVRENDAGDGG
jgi:chromosome segregation ATPase